MTSIFARLFSRLNALALPRHRGSNVVRALPRHGGWGATFALPRHGGW
jgi:hypothetical protein